MTFPFSYIAAAYLSSIFNNLHGVEQSKLTFVYFKSIFYESLIIKRETTYYIDFYYIKTYILSLIITESIPIISSECLLIYF